MMKLDKETKILFFGDSITHGGRFQSMDGNHIIGHGYPDIISSKLGYDNMENMPKFINKGVSGESVADLYSRLNQDVIKNKPDIISILVGINDIFKGSGLPYKMTTNKYINIYQLMIDDIKALLDNPKIIICEPFLLELEANREKPFEKTPYAYCEPDFNLCINEESLKRTRKELTYMQEELKKFAERNECIYVPLQDKFFEVSESVPPEYFVWDTIHPTIVGHELIARQWLRVLGGN